MTAPDFNPITEVDLRDRLERHHGEAFAWAIVCCRGNRNLAEDALQTAYLKILDGRARFVGASKFRTWLFSVIRNTAVDRWRSPWHRRRVPLSEVTPPVTEPEQEREALDPDELAEAFAALPTRQAQVLSLVYGHEMTVREVAGVLRISKGSVAQHLHRGKHRLRERFGQAGR